LTLISGSGAVLGARIELNSPSDQYRIEAAASQHLGLSSNRKALILSKSGDIARVRKTPPRVTGE
jgi:hypothetical protein